MKPASPPTAWAGAYNLFSHAAVPAGQERSAGADGANRGGPRPLAKVGACGGPCLPACGCCALTQPRAAFCIGCSMECDVLIIDEAQDVSACFAAVLERQVRCAKILVGDPQQQIYSFAGAVNAMQGLRDSALGHFQRQQQEEKEQREDGEVREEENPIERTPQKPTASAAAALQSPTIKTPAQVRYRPAAREMRVFERTLTTSFRFSRPIAAVANDILWLLGSRV